MSIWSRLLASAQRLFDPQGDEDLPERDGSSGCAPDPNDLAFTAAVIGLGAKMAKADGFVSEREIAVFSQVFRAAPEDAVAVRRVFDIARQTVRGYESYAKRIARRYADRPCLLEGILDGLFFIAGADGVVKPEEIEYLKSVADIFGFEEPTFRRIRASHFGSEPGDPYAVLGVNHSESFDVIRVAYRKLMADNHPDRVVTNGAPREFEVAAHEKAAAITSAYARIRAERGMLVRAD